jgi:hypothetical protein
MKDGRRFGRPPDPYKPPETPTGKINVTDADSQLVKATRGWIQGYNAQAAVNEQQIVIAAELTVDSPEFGHLEPIVDAAERELERIGVSESPGVVVADAGYWHQAQMENIVSRGVKVLIPPDSRKRKGARPGGGGGAYAFMRRVLQTDASRELYRKRQAMIEPVFGHTKFNRRDRPLPATRKSRLPLRMAANHRHPQPPQAPQPPTGARSRLRRPKAVPTAMLIIKPD